MAALLLPLTALAQAANPLRIPGPLSPRLVAYRISATLDPEKKRVHGVEHLTWHNNTETPAQNLKFHLYMNAFKNQDSTFIRESHGGQLRGDSFKTGKWGYIQV